MAARHGIRLTLALLAAMLCAGCGGGNGPAFETVTIRGETFELEVAADEPSRVRGLMDRPSIPAGGGMLFIFPDANIRSFWMANCLVDIDVIFLDSQGRITAQHRMKALSPRREDESDFEYQGRMRQEEYSSMFAAQFAIELKAGTLDRLDLEFQERIDLDLPRLKALPR
jgi:uncharacterized membrane protein (UPF0127 family)